MRIICPVKRVPDTAADKKIADDNTVDRDASEPVLNANDEWSIEEAMRIKERGDAEVVALCMGPDSAQTTVRKALSYGLDAAIQVTDDAIAGSDAYQTAKVLAAALADEEFDLVIMGNQSSDARTTLVPAMVAEFLNIPSLTYCKKLEIDGDTVRAERETPTGHQVVEAKLPVLVSVVEAINEPRYPSFKGIMAAKSKPLTTKALADIGVDAGEVGIDNATTQVLEIEPRPPKQAGEKVEDDGSGSVGASALADFLAQQKLI
ncbi:electron transfer flavoprotein subunit beta/FixA family protein [soil metagenome]